MGRSAVHCVYMYMQTTFNGPFQRMFHIRVYATGGERGAGGKRNGQGKRNRRSGRAIGDRANNGTRTDHPAATVTQPSRNRHAAGVISSSW